MTSGDFWVRKKLLVRSRSAVLMLSLDFRSVFSVILGFYMFCSDTQSSRYIVFLFLSGDIKSISLIHLKRNFSCCLIFGNINDDYTEKKVLCLIFPPPVACLSHTLPQFLYQCVRPRNLRFEPSKEIRFPPCTGQRSVYLHSPNNLNK